jgi:hypothetical protein
MMSKADSDDAAKIKRRAPQESVDFEGQPHLLPFVGTADEHASESGFAGQVDGRMPGDPDGNAEHSHQRARRRAAAATNGTLEEEDEEDLDGSDGKASSSAAGDLADGLELLRKAAEKAGPPRDPRVEEISERALSRLRQVDDPKSTPEATRVDDSTLQGAAAQAGEEILSLIHRVSHRIVRLTEEEAALAREDDR